MTDTDELIETLERLEKEATLRPWHADGYVIRVTAKDWLATFDRKPDRDLSITLRNHFPALISALKENQRLREALTDLVSAVDDGEHDHSNVENEPCETCSAWLRASAALQPQGEK